MSFSATGRIPVRPLSYEYSPLVLPKELLTDYSSGELYVCLEDGTIISVSDSMIQHIKDLSDLADYIEIDVGNGETIMLSALYERITNEYKYAISHTKYAGSSEPGGAADSVANDLIITRYNGTTSTYNGSKEIRVDPGEFAAALVCYWLSTDGVTDDDFAKSDIEDDSSGNDESIDTGSDTSETNKDDENEGIDEETSGTLTDDDRLNQSLPDSVSWFSYDYSTDASSAAATALKTEVINAISNETNSATFAQFMKTNDNLVGWLGVYNLTIKETGVPTLASPIYASNNNITSAFVIYYNEETKSWEEIGSDIIITSSTDSDGNTICWVYATFDITGPIAVAVYTRYSIDDPLNLSLPDSASWFSYTISGTSSSAVSELNNSLTSGYIPEAIDNCMSSADEIVEYLGCYTLTISEAGISTLVSPIALSDTNIDGAIYAYYDETNAKWVASADTKISTVDGKTYVYATLDITGSVAMAVVTVKDTSASE